MYEPAAFQRKADQEHEWQKTTMNAVSCGDVEYFKTAFEEADNTPNRWKTRVKLIEAALNSEQTKEWAKEQSFAEIMLADNERGLREMIGNVYECYSNGISSETIEKIIKIIGAERRVVEILLEKNEIMSVCNKADYLIGKDIITREFCLHDNGSLLHKVWDKMRKNLSEDKSRIKSDAEMEAALKEDIEAGRGNDDEVADQRRILTARKKMDLGHIKWVIKRCKLSKSDLASVGLPWPWQWPPPKLL
jgi:hypothetical protein